MCAVLVIGYCPLTLRRSSSFQGGNPTGKGIFYHIFYVCCVTQLQTVALQLWLKSIRLFVVQLLLIGFYIDPYLGMIILQLKPFSLLKSLRHRI